MKFVKYLLFLLLASGTTNSRASTSESWTDPETGMSWWYTVEGNAATLGWGSWKAPAISKTTEGPLVVPSHLNGYLVVGVGRDAFYGSSELTSVTLPESVSFIDERAFQGCSKLAVVSVPQLNEIGREAFDGTALISNHPDGLVVIGSVLYKVKGDCPKSVIVSEGVTRIESEVFRGCANLETISLPGSLRSIGSASFYQCENIQSISFPTNVDVIALDAFSGCASLSTLQFLGRVGSIEARAFSNCPKINSVVLPEGLQSLGYGCFSGTGLRLVSLPSTLEHNYDGGVWPFSGCYGVTNVVTAAPVALRKLFNDATTNIVEVTIPDDVSEICSECLMNCSGIRNFKIPTSVTNIGYSAFMNCCSIEAIDIHPGVVCIGERAFANCYSLKKIFIPRTTVSVGMDTFMSCTNLEEAIVDACIEGIPARMFSMCVNLSNVSISATARYLSAEAFSGCRSLREITIPESVSSLYSCVFYGCTGLASIYMNGDAPGYVMGEYDAPFIGVNAKVYVWPWRQWNVGGKYCGLDVVSRVPSTWADGYPLFAQKYGDDPIAALKLSSGKKSSSGEEMYVWQDYVAGTDPTDIESKFVVHLKIEKNRPVIDWSPKLTDEETDKRRYRIWGKECLNDSLWEEIQLGHEDGYHYFKGTVEMK